MKKRYIPVILIAALFLNILIPGLGAAQPGGVVPGEPVEAIGREEVAQKQLAAEKIDDLPFIGDRDENKIADDLDGLIEAQGDEKVPVVVRLKENPSEKVLKDLETHIGVIERKAQWEKALKGFSAMMTPEQIRALSKNPMVERIDMDREVKAFINTATQWTGVQAARSDFGVDGDRDGNKTSYSKNDVVIAVLDTGIDAGHVDLDGGKVIGWYDVINGRTTPYDDNGHGTHVASIAAGTGEGNPAYKGVAPGAALVGIKVLNSAGSGTISGIISGIEWMIQNKNTYGIRIGNMSLGAAGSSDGTDSLSQAVNNAVNNGIIMVVAAGNEGPARYTIGSPAAAANAITVGSLYDPGERGWVLSEFSSRGPTADNRIKPDITAPGSNITAARAGTTSGYVTYSGTSMATPFISGVIALMLDANYALTDSQVKNILYSSANVKDFGPSGKDIDFGYGINLSYNCIKQAGGFAGSFSDGIGFSFIQDSLSGTGNTDWWQFDVTDTTKPIGITFVMPNHTSSIDFDIYLYDPNDTLVASSTGTARQEQIRYTPTKTGTYKLRVYSYRGSGNYWFNVSWK
ncbi:S8 family serine peptidase [Thermosediminibacter oceani]|uniref:Peptidase S8 and S53 subtilisin kexin sedolisin n=1 Tax=Thermosediminibacter oceani (strain ATCC BAA-1034 / DSM 16646 / JW/IW-1228P) TaxID=555079 RepID=D9RYT7_THEOJ|nr:S8 family serine peptidase [Thermosediminibacter oceani]ADL08511.1 peptidase S8 and S53 subtilisin kexin sedolisin [Thermosediminibacter oceani DSM 16646]